MNKKMLIELKAKMLCEGVNPDESAVELFQKQNPSGIKRGGLSSGGKIELPDGFFVNVPFYKDRGVDLAIIADVDRERGIVILDQNRPICEATILTAPDWYKEKVGEFNITQILTAHNQQLAGAVFEDCALFGRGDFCKFCVICHSLKQKIRELVIKCPEIFLKALEKIPLDQYGGLSLNGGMTLHPGRGIELIEPVIRAVHKIYPDFPIAVEITPPIDLGWIDKITEAGVSSLMMNLECWDSKVRERLIPGKDKFCSRESYLAAFERALSTLGPGRVTTCFVVGSEPLTSLKEGISTVIERGVIPSPLAGRYFEDVQGYPFTPLVRWQDFLEVLYFTAELMSQTGLRSTDRAGCVACRMCDLIRDMK